MADERSQGNPQKDDPEDHKKSLKRSWKSSGPVARLTVVFAGIAALSTAVYALFAGGQLVVMQWQFKAIGDTNGINREALQTVQRAYMVVESQPHFVEVEKDPKSREITKYRFQMIMENLGNTPTSNLKYHVNIVAINQPLPDDFQYPNFAHDGTVCGPNSPQKECADVYAAAGPKVMVWSPYLDLTSDYVSAIKQRGYHVYFYGRVDYKDRFEWTPPRVTEYCTELMKIEPGETPRLDWGVCAKHNCTDEDCTDYKH
jgi:hypothetical protein